MAHPQPVVVILAQATIQGAIKVESRAPPEVHLRAGQDLQVRCLYRTLEASRGKESYRLRLDSSLGLLRQDPVTVELHDRPIVDEENWGSLQQTYRPRQSGSYALEYTLRAVYDTRPWSGGDDDKQRQELEHKGSVQVTVT